MQPFPTGFLWGTSQSGHQIEGENYDSDWWHWEQRPGRIAGGANSQEAALHLRDFERDFDLARDLGHNTFLFSIEWARIQPREGEFSEEAITHYRGVFEALQSRGLEPLCVLQHVTLPKWFADRYGWHHPKAPALFRDYAARMAAEFSRDCRWWIPIREPMHWCTMAFMLRQWPPASRNLDRARKALSNMARGHALAYHTLKEACPEAKVGTAIHARLFQALDPDSPWDVRCERREQRRCNHLWLDALCGGRWPLRGRPDPAITGTIDFIGVAYYGIETVRFSAMKPSCIFSQLTGPTGEARTCISFTTWPEGLSRVLGDLSRYGLPIIVTANGIATDDDTVRCRYLVDHVRAVRQALDDGVDVRGYCLRSFLDGFEWEAGYSRRYGIIHVDRKSLVRTPNPSALLYKELCTTNVLGPGTIAKYSRHQTEPLRTEAVT